MIEAPSSVIGIRSARRKMHQTTIETGATELAYTRGELEYLLVHSGFVEIAFHPVDALTRSKVKLGIRKLLRKLGCEDLLLSASYLIHARKC